MANVRSAYANIVSQYLTNADTGYSMTVAAQQTQDEWQNSENGHLTIQVDGKESKIDFDPVMKGGNYTVAIDKDGSVTVS